MIEWVKQFFTSLPSWYWVLLFAGTTYSGLRLIEGVVSGRIKTNNESEGHILWPGFLLLIIPAVTSAMMAHHTTKAVPYSTWVGFQMMAIGLVAFIARSFPGFIMGPVPEGARSATESTIDEEEDAEPETDPERIIAECKQQLADAARERGLLDLGKLDEEGTNHFVQEGERLLQFLRDLFELVEYLDRALEGREDARERADAVYPEVPFNDSAWLPRIEMLEAKHLEKLRRAAKKNIEDTIYVFSRLSAGVFKDKALYHADRIEGLRELTRDLLPSPEKSSMTGIVAALETGLLQERMQNRLAQAVRAVPTAPHATEQSSKSVAPPQRRRVRA